MNIIIDGRTLEVQGHATVLEVARAHGIDIPTLCDHARLAPYSACRVCLVSVKGRPGYQPSCSMAPSEGMEVVTDSPEIRSLRRLTVELILSEHPNACLVCTEKKNCDDHKGTIRKVGEVTGCVLCPGNKRCELQETAAKVGVDSVRFPAAYRNLEVKRADPFFVQDYNLCILCGRCVRMCAEVRGASVIAFIHRGPQAVVGTVLDRGLVAAGCQFCGACVDACPTGALTERTSRHEAPPERSAPTLCPCCGVGCGLTAELRSGRPLPMGSGGGTPAPETPGAGRLVSTPPSEDGVNRGQACVRGRFTLTDLVYSPRRLKTPMVRTHGKLVAASWEDALTAAAEGLKGRKGASSALVLSGQLGAEDIHVLARLGREALSTKNIVSSLGTSILDGIAKTAESAGVRVPPPPKLSDLASAKKILVVGEDIAVTHPVAWVAAFEAAAKGGRLLSVCSKEVRHNRHAAVSLRPRPGAEASAFTAVSKALEGLGVLPKGTKGADAFSRSLAGVSLAGACEGAGITEAEARSLAEELAADGPPAIFLVGATLAGSDGLASLWNLAVQTGSRILPLAEESNTRGLWSLLRDPSSRPADLNALLGGIRDRQVKALYMAGPLGLTEKHGLEFLVVQDSFESPACAFADVILPAATFAEAGGTFMNMEGLAQSVEPVIEAVGSAKPDWWIASALASKMGAGGFDFANRPAVLKDIAAAGLLSPDKSPADPDYAPQQAAAKRGTETPPACDTGADHYRSMALVDTSRDFQVLRRRRRAEPSSEEACASKTGEAQVLRSPEGAGRPGSKAGSAWPLPVGSGGGTPSPETPGSAC